MTDIAQMTFQEVLQEASKMAERWRNAPHISNDYLDGLKYGQLVERAKSLGQKLEIRADQNPTDYQVF